LEEAEVHQELKCQKKNNKKERKKTGRQKILHQSIALPDPNLLFSLFLFVRVVPKYQNYSSNNIPKIPDTTLLSKFVCNATDDQCSITTPISGIFWQFVPTFLLPWSPVRGVSGIFKSDTA
jgi:hypothetical protein